MKLFAIYTILQLFWVLPCFAQDSLFSHNGFNDFPDSTFIVEKIIVRGNEHTKDFVIEREMSLKPGSPITHQLLEYDKNRIYSLALFTRIELKIVPTVPPMAIVVVEVSERWFLFPYPIFGIKDRDWGKVYYGLGVVHTNFRGRNEKLALSLVFGYDPSVALFYRNPFMNEEGTSFLESRLSYSKVRNRSVQALIGNADFDEKHFQVSLTVGKRFSIQHTLWLSLGFERVDISDVIPLRTLSENGIDAYPIFGAGYTYDSRDLGEYPGYGSFFRASITKFGFPAQTVDVVRYAADYRRYIPLAFKFVLAARTFTDLAAAGKTPGYNHDFFGYGERIRGHFKEITEGESQFGISTELHYPLFEPRYFTVGFLPREFAVWKFAVFAAAFADAGTVWFRGHPVSVNNFISGYGLGLHFLLPYGSVIRTEYAWDEFGKGEFIIGSGVTF